MAKYENAELEIINFDTEDVITTSACLVDAFENNCVTDFD